MEVAELLDGILVWSEEHVAEITAALERYDAADGQVRVAGSATIV